MAGTVEQKLAEQGIVLHQAPAPVANYVPFVRTGNPVIVMDERSAEMTKYAANAFLATKISFINEIANLCERVGADVDMVRKGLGADAMPFDGLKARLFTNPRRFETFDLHALDGGHRFGRDVQAAVGAGIGQAGQAPAVFQLLGGVDLLLGGAGRGDLAGEQLYLAGEAFALSAADADQADAQLAGAFQEGNSFRALASASQGFKFNLIRHV